MGITIFGDFTLQFIYILLQCFFLLFLHLMAVVASYFAEKHFTLNIL